LQGVGEVNEKQAAVFLRQGKKRKKPQGVLLGGERSMQGF
jgi:hypothetical protein